MRRILFVCMLMLVAVGTQAQAYQSPVAFIPEQAMVGKKLTVTYNTELTELKGARAVDMVAYFWHDYRWTAIDAPMIKSGNLWMSVIDIPTDAALLTLKFVADDKVDIGGRNTYSQFTVDSLGRNLPSSYLGWGLFRGEYTYKQYGIPGYINDSTCIANDVFLFWCNQDLRYFPMDYPRVSYYAADGVVHKNPAKADSIIRRDIVYIMSIPADKRTEKNLLDIYTVCNKYLHDKSLSDSIESLALSDYPDGIFARDKEVRRLFMTSDIDAKTRGFEALLKRFPTSRFENVSSPNVDLFYAKLMQSVIYNAIVKNNDYSLMYKYIHDIPYGHLSTYYWHMVQIPYRNGDMKADALMPHAELIMTEIMNRPREYRNEVYSPREWNAMVWERNKAALFTHARLLNDLGRKEEAMKIMDRLSPMFAYADAEFYTVYISMLDGTQRRGEIIPIIEACVKNNAAGPEMLGVLRDDYKVRNGSENGYEEYLQKLKSSAHLQAMQEEIESNIVKLPIELFAMKDLDGNTVDLSRMKGKILVLDFWATWCAPCKASFPGMQMAVDKYADDENVEFFFIATMETAPDYKAEIRKFLKSKGFNMNVLLDNTAQGAKSNDVVYSRYCKDFHFSGIPQKLIVDGDGYLRYRSTGYHGSPSALVDEISFVIEYLKNEN